MRGAAHILRAGSVALLCALALWAQTDSYPAATPTSSAPAVTTLKVAAGERLVLELQDSLHTAANQVGDHVHFQTYREIVVGYQVVVPQGSSVRGTLTKVKKPGRAGRAGEMSLRFDEIILPDGTVLPLTADLLRAGFINIDNGKDGASVKGDRGIRKSDSPESPSAPARARSSDSAWAARRAPCTAGPPGPGSAWWRSCCAKAHTSICLAGPFSRSS